MTLILTVLGEDTGLFALGDILVSAQRTSDPGLALPLQFEPHLEQSAGFGLTGFAQKLVVVSPTIVVSWAGSYAVARALIAAIRDAARGCAPLDLPGVVDRSGLAPAEVELVSLIVHERVGPEIRVATLHAEQSVIDGVDAAWAGSGAFDFITDMIIDDGGGGLSDQAILRKLMLRLALTLREEAIEKRPYDFLYGGWFELIISRTLGLRKIPYAIKFWGRRPGEIGYDAPVFFSWYKAKSLFVCSLDQHPGSSDVRVVEVPDLLSGKRWRKVGVRPIFRPEFTFHVVMDEKAEHQRIYVSDRHSVGHMTLHVNKRGNYRMAVSRVFVDQIMGDRIEPQFVVTRASSAAC